MGDLFTIPDIAVDRREVNLFQTPPPDNHDASYAAELGRRFGIGRDPEDLGAILVTRDERSALELFVASHSVRYTVGLDASSELATAPSGFDAETALAEAARFYREHEDLFGIEGAEPAKPGTTELLVQQQGEREPAAHIVAHHANWQVALEGVPVIGPGAKAQVSVAAEGQVAGAYRFWRKPQRSRSRPLISAEEAVERFQRDDAYRQLDPETCSVVVDRGYLAYYALPPRELQRYLFPVYALEGRVATRALPEYGFVRYVVAVDVRPAEVKRSGAIHRAPVAVF